MEQEIDHKIQLSSILNDPDRLRHSDIPLLKELVAQYPYFQPLRLILAKLSMETEAAEDTLTTTALYTNGAVLHQFLHRKPVVQATVALEEEASFVSDEQVVSPADKEQTELVYTDHEQPEEIDCVEEVNDALTDDQETFEEITEINIHDYEVAAPENTGVVNAPVIETLEDNFVENIAATDFFTFEERFIAEDKPSTAPSTASTQDTAEGDAEPQSGGYGLSLSRAANQASNAGAGQSESENSALSNYDDDSLPYTFLWWLAKTRKEHSSTFQPYATPKKQGQNELHQQYVEHIFHIQSPFNAEEILNNVPEHQADPKDAKIIDEFIKKDPQITPPRPEQIDNENKAKRSAEDHNDLVSETLAKIYIEQMLYHKAIDTYEKLSLKFPEKSRYFADLIQSIKKKI